MSIKIVKYRSLEKAFRAEGLIGNVVFSQLRFYDSKGSRGYFGGTLSLDKKLKPGWLRGLFLCSKG